ncbi:MAG: RNase H1/viroplasmin domain-containing protein [Endomicrobium sp.]|nr:RNase H1/viroplasmin domain-containing protein [Endomicrobium sp.]
MYAIVASSFSGIYDRWEDVEKIICIYPYPKYRKFKTKEECLYFINRYKHYRGLDTIRLYGNVFEKHYITMEYFIRESLYYNFDISKLGYVKLVSDDAIIKYTPKVILARINNVVANNDSLFGHMVAIFHGLNILGDIIDVNIVVPDHAIFYALSHYKGENRIINQVKKRLRERLGNYALSLQSRLL